MGKTDIKLQLVTARVYIYTHKMHYESPEEKEYSSVCKAIHKSGNMWTKF